MWAWWHTCIHSGWPWWAQTWARVGPRPSLSLELIQEDLPTSARTHRGEPAAKAKTIGGSSSLSNMSTFSWYATIASTSSAEPRRHAKCKAVCPSVFCASKRERIKLSFLSDAAFASRSLVFTKGLVWNSIWCTCNYTIFAKDKPNTSSISFTYKMM
jgi:hypothetical protein